MDRSVLAVLPRASLEEDHDTTPDARIVRRRFARTSVALPHFDLPNREERPAIAPRPRGAPISEEEALSPARASQVRVREACVRLHRTDRDPPTAPPPAFVPEVRIAFVRSSDPHLKISRHGPDGFLIRGEVARDNAAVSIGVEGRMFSIRLVAGDSAAHALDQMIERLASTFRLELVERSPARAILRLTAEAADSLG